MTRKTLFIVLSVIAVCAVSVALGHNPAHVTSVFDGAPLMAMAIASVPNDLSYQGSPSGTLTIEQNRQRLLQYFRTRNGVISTTVAALPAVARGTTASKVKTTNATVTKHAGVQGNAVGATDDAWTLTGAAIVNASGANQFVRYLLLVSSADAFTVQRSSVAATAAACAFDNLPADGLAIAGILTVQITNGTTFTPGATLLSAAGITDTYIDGDCDDAVDALGGRLVTNQ